MQPGWPRRFGGEHAGERSPNDESLSPDGGGKDVLSNPGSIPSTRDTSPTSSIASSRADRSQESWVGRAIFEFTPADAVETALTAGDLLQVFPYVAAPDGWYVVSNHGVTGLVPQSYVSKADEDGKVAYKAGSSGERKHRSGRSSKERLLIDSRDRSKRDLELMSVDALQSELEMLDVCLEKDIATLRLRYAKRRQHLEAAIRGKPAESAGAGGVLIAHKQTAV